MASKHRTWLRYIMIFDMIYQQNFNSICTAKVLPMWQKLAFKVSTVVCSTMLTLSEKEMLLPKRSALVHERTGSALPCFICHKNLVDGAEKGTAIDSHSYSPMHFRCYECASICHSSCLINTAIFGIKRCILLSRENFFFTDDQKIKNDKFLQELQGSIKGYRRRRKTTCLVCGCYFPKNYTERILLQTLLVLYVQNMDFNIFKNLFKLLKRGGETQLRSDTLIEIIVDSGLAHLIENNAFRNGLAGYINRGEPKINTDFLTKHSEDYKPDAQKAELRLLRIWSMQRILQEKPDYIEFYKSLKTLDEQMAFLGHLHESVANDMFLIMIEKLLESSSPSHKTLKSFLKIVSTFLRRQNATQLRTLVMHYFNATKTHSLLIAIIEALDKKSDIRLLERIFHAVLGEESFLPRCVGLTRKNCQEVLAALLGTKAEFDFKLVLTAILWTMKNEPYLDMKTKEKIIPFVEPYFKEERFFRDNNKFQQCFYLLFLKYYSPLSIKMLLECTSTKYLEGKSLLRLKEDISTRQLDVFGHILESLVEIYRITKAKDLHVYENALKELDHK
ncbi:hypothetical protein ENBRE01_1172 [Enteropsectra breve]|nr:hypothetical protein ENBRE01_1172 [Enteropsectra breve]